jgi:hypothetical protein
MPAQNYVLLERVEVGATAVSSITFNSIPQTGYTDLKIVVSGREVTGTSLLFTMQINGVATNQSTREVRGSGSSATSGTNTIATIDQNGSGTTASTFGNAEVYIPNYTSANYKSYSIDSVSENNATAAYMRLSAGLWSQNAAITSLSFFPSSGTIAQYSSFSLYGLAAVGTTPTKAPKASGGSIIQTDGTYWYHAFLASGTFTPAVGLTCDYLVVAGGGGGGREDTRAGGGGGAGGLRSTVTATGGGGSLESALSLASGTGYTVTIGAGGAGTSANSNPGSVGSNSVFSTITSTGGGFGNNNGFGGTGGSGGAGGYTNTAIGIGTGTANQGFNSGVCFVASSIAAACGGGGGSGAVGSNGVSNVGGTGGAGVAITALATATSTGVSGYYAGGGGGGSSGGGTGGSGGGGNGGSSGAVTAGTPNTGSGGGGSGSGNSGKGASGIVIIRYLVA